MDILFIFLIVSLVVNITLFIAIGVSGSKRPKVIGAVIVLDNDNLYVELDNEQSITELHSNNYVAFRIDHRRK